MDLENKFKKETGLDAYILNDLRGRIATDTYVEWLEEKCNIPIVVGQSKQLINFTKEVIEMYEKYDIGDEDIYRKAKAIIN